MLDYEWLDELGFAVAEGVDLVGSAVGRGRQRTDCELPEKWSSDAGLKAGSVEDEVTSCCVDCEVKRLPDFGSDEVTAQPTSTVTTAVAAVAAVAAEGS